MRPKWAATCCIIASTWAVSDTSAAKPRTSTPLARVISTELLEFGQWRGLYLFELGLSLLSLGGVLLVRLPPGDRIKVFEKQDLVSVTLLSAGMALLCAVLSLGRIVWWREAEWIGWSLAASIVLVTAGIAHEHFRANPLINTRWLSSGLIIPRRGRNRSKIGPTGPCFKCANTDSGTALSTTVRGSRSISV